MNIKIFYVKRSDFDQCCISIRDGGVVKFLKLSINTECLPEVKNGIPSCLRCPLLLLDWLLNERNFRRCDILRNISRLPSLALGPSALEVCPEVKDLKLRNWITS